MPYKFPINPFLLKLTGTDHSLNYHNISKKNSDSQTQKLFGPKLPKNVQKNWIFNIQIPQWHPQNSTGLFFTWPFNSNCLTNFLSTLFLRSWWVLITLRTITIVWKRIFDFQALEPVKSSGSPGNGVFKDPNCIRELHLSVFHPTF